MIPGLKEGQYKMSKSSPESAIFMEDSAEDVKKKIKNAFCPPKILENNPCIDFTKYFVFDLFGELKLERTESNGGNVTYTNWDDVLRDYEADKIWPADLKNALTNGLNSLLEPVRRHFQNNTEAKQLLATIKRYQEEIKKTK